MKIPKNLLEFLRKEELSYRKSVNAQGKYVDCRDMATWKSLQLLYGLYKTFGRLDKAVEG